jgi:hypothetical protein
VKLSNFVWRTGPLAVCLGLILAGSIAAEEQEPPPPPTPGETVVPPVPPVEDPAATPSSGKTLIMVHTVPQADPAAGVYAGYTGKSPCGEFDVPYNDYFGDTRIFRSVILGRLWVSGEYLAWDTKGVRLPALVTTSPAGTAFPDAGVIGVAGTTTLFGDDEFHDTVRSGGRLNFGYWLSPAHEAGIEVDMFWLDGRNIAFAADSGTFPILAHPTVTGGANDSVVVAFPGIQTDGATLVQSDMGLFGIEVLERWMLNCAEDQRLDFVAGYRHMRLIDGLRIDDAFISDDVASGFLPGTLVARTDSFESRNDFHGGEVGFVYRWWNCCWALQVTAKAAFGETHTFTTVDGETVADDGVTETVTAGGVLAQPANIGAYSRNKFSMVGEVAVRGEYAITSQLRWMLGYNVLTWSDVSRVPDSIDLASPAFTFQTRDFWAHGVTTGLYYDF